MNIITYKYISPVYKNCAPSAAQKGALSTDQTWGTTLSNSYNTVFQAGSSMFKSLSGKLNSIINNPQGYSAQDLAMQNSQTLNTAAANAQKVNAAIGQRAGTQSGAVPGVESGVEQATRASADTSILNNMSNQQAGITEKSDELAIQRQDAAIKEQMALPGAAFDPATAAAATVTSANAATAAQANQNAATSDQWVGLVGGLADSAVSGLTSGGMKGIKSLFGGKSASTSSSGGSDVSGSSNAGTSFS